MSARTELPIREIRVSDQQAGPYAVYAGPDDALWLTLAHSGSIGRLALDETWTEFQLDPPTCAPMIITTGPDEAMWYTRSGDHRIGRIGLDGQTETFPIPTADAEPFGITTGPADALWFTELGSDRIGRISPEGQLSEFVLPVTGGVPSGITTGPGGAPLFTLNQANANGRIALDGTIAVYPIPTAASGPVGITSDGEALWFVEIAAGQLGRLTSAGEFTEYALPDRSAKPHAIVATGVGDCWFTEWAGNAVGHLIVSETITERGAVTEPEAVTEHRLPSAASEPHGICRGPDGALWVALETGGVARLDGSRLDRRR